MEKKLDEKNVPIGARKKLPFCYLLAWTSRNISSTLGVLLIGYISFFCTDVLGMNIGIVGGLLLASKAVDAVTDLGVGYLIDRTHTRWGKARPYEVFIILQWIFTILLFAVPNASRPVQYVYVFIMYVMVNAICLTALGAADAVYMSRAFTTDENRTKVISFAGVFIMIVSILISIFLPLFLTTPEGATQAGWIKLSIMLGVPLALIGMFRFIFVKEILTDDTVQNADLNITDSKNTNKVALTESVGLLLKNKYALIIIVLMLVSNLLQNMGTANTYYFKYIYGDIGVASLIGMLNFVTPVMLIFFPLLCKKFGTTGILRIAMAIGIVSTLIRTIGGTNLTTIMIGSLGGVLAILPITVTINTYLIECMDYGEWINGTRVEGLIASVANFSGKVGAALASGFVGVVMGLAGYDGNLAVQSASANTAIIGMYNIFPLILYVIMLVLALAYKMDSVRPQMKADLEKKHAGQK